MKQLLCILITLLAVGSASAAEKNYCGDLRNGFGPFDYRERATLPAELQVVERHHFSPEVEGGIRGANDSINNIGADLWYTLRAWPNHHRALISMSTIALRTKTVMLPGAVFPVECWFNRAIRFAPNDGTVHAIYGNYLLAVGRNDPALNELKQAVDMEPENPVINYNLGLVYFKNKDYDLALKHAQKAYSKDYPLPGLKKKLIEVGKWVEPTREKIATDSATGRSAEATSDRTGTAAKPAE